MTEVVPIPRQARKQSKTGIYHLMIRGINRQRIFEDNEDCDTFIETIWRSKEKIGFELYGYCIMGNHVHLLMKEKDSLSLVMQSICSRYVYWYNWKYDRVGHLFQERYKSEIVETEAYLLTVLRYIHQNPLKAGITSKVGEYRWSSYNEYLGQQRIIDPDFVLGFFAMEKDEAEKRYIAYMNETNQDVCLDYKERHRITDEEVIKILEGKYGVKRGGFHALPRIKVESILRSLKEIEGVSIRQLVRVTGMSKFIVEKS